MNRSVRAAALTVFVAAVAGAVVAVTIQGQISRHRRDLFSPRAFRRLAALGHIGREPASVDYIRLLQDFIAWEPRKMLRERATAIVGRMLDDAERLRLEALAETA
jgi:hypothetical protein